jgi:hypothetical protein
MFMDHTSAIQLAPPGAGLPPTELFVGRLLFTFRRLSGTRDGVRRKFQSERERIRSLIRDCKPEQASKRVLIPRQRGMEDSSRNWSIWMTLDHLRIVHRSIARTISALSAGKSPEGKASTAAVKPSPEATASVLDEYEKSCDDLVALVDAIPDLKTAKRFEHPWFGRLDAEGWHALASSHLAIHRAQIERIREGLAASM